MPETSMNSYNAPIDTGVRHILVLDDEHAIRVALSRLLESLNHNCTTASTGESLLEIIESARNTSTSYDLAILDIKIAGGMGGIETMQRMQQLGINIPVISMSGYSITEIFADDEERNGFLGHLEKPFNAVQLLNEIERLCKF